MFRLYTQRFRVFTEYSKESTFWTVYSIIISIAMEGVHNYMQQNSGWVLYYVQYKIKGQVMVKS